MRKTIRPTNPIHPGEMLLQEFLLPMNKSQADFASELGWSASRLNALVNGKRGVTAYSALDLAHVLGTSPELWMKMQVAWDLERAEKRRKAS